MGRRARRGDPRAPGAGRRRLGRQSLALRHHLHDAAARDRAGDRVAPATRADAEELLLRRLDDLVTGIASPGANERLQFARQLVARQGIDPTTEAGQQQARIYLVKARERVIAELARYRRAAESARRPGNRGGELTAYSTMYSDRGLSSDTRLTADFALDKALEAIAAKGTLAARSVRRVAIVGPGLDFTDKAEGFDFYPQQTIQPFALVDSLGRFDLGQPDEIRVTTLDLSPRVNGHLESARARASAAASPTWCSCR